MLAAASCGGFGGPTPSGERTYVRVLDQDYVEHDGQRIDWTELGRRIRARVAAAERGEAEPPWVVIETSPEVAERLGAQAGSRLGSRLMDLLTGAGVRSIDVGR